MPITLGNQTLNDETDTGSSDTWLVQTGFQFYHTYDNTSGLFVGILDSSVGQA